MNALTQIADIDVLNILIPNSRIGPPFPVPQQPSRSRGVCPGLTGQPCHHPAYDPGGQSSIATRAILEVTSALGSPIKKVRVPRQRLY
jgi:hypothetical protein